MNPLSRAGLLPMQVHIAIAAGDLDTAGEALTELDGIRAAFPTRTLQATVLSTRGRIELAQDEAAEATGTLQAALEKWRALDVPYEVVTVHTLLGAAQRRSGDDTAAAESFTAVTELLDQIGARLGGATKPTFPAGLTVREVEVLR